MSRIVNKVKCLNERRCYVLADVIIFVYEAPCIFWHYINVDEVTLITLKKLLQTAMELLQIVTAQFITKCDGQLLQIVTTFLLQSATRFITNCDWYYKVRWIYYKLRQVLQSAMIITNCDRTLTAWLSQLTCAFRRSLQRMAQIHCRLTALFCPEMLLATSCSLFLVQFNCCRSILKKNNNSNNK